MIITMLLFLCLLLGIVGLLIVNNHRAKNQEPITTQKIAAAGETEPVKDEVPDEEFTYSIQSNKLQYGQLSLDVPRGWKTGEETAEDGSKQVFLEDCREGIPELYEYKIIFEHFELSDVEQETHQEALLMKVVYDRLKQDFDVTNYVYHDHPTESYEVYQLETEQEKIWLYVFSQMTYLIREPSSAYLLVGDDYDSLQDMKFRVTLQDGTVAANDDTYQFRYEGKVRSVDENTVLYFSCYQIENEEKVVVYDCNHIERELQTIEERWTNDTFEILDEADINFDGSVDFRFDETWYLWNQEEHQLIPTGKIMSDENVEYSLLPDDKLIWQYDGVIDGDPGEERGKESLWQWQDGKLICVRECTEKISNDRVTLYAWDYESNCEIFEKSFSLKDIEGQQKCFAEFYEGKTNPILYFKHHEVENSQHAIPEGLIALITHAIEQKNELEVMKPMVHDRELEYDEVAAIAERSPDVKSNFTALLSNSLSEAAFIETDGDNDGIPDIMAEELGGGSLRLSEFVFFKGKKDGTYEQTSLYPHMHEEFAFLQYEGKNYLGRTTFDFGRKVYDGFEIYEYQNGERIERVRIRQVLDSYQDSISQVSQPYQKLIGQMRKQGMKYYQNVVRDYSEITGSAETEQDEMYVSDYNNDGVMECYDKYVWLCSSNSAMNYLSLTEYEMPEPESEVSEEGSEELKEKVIPNASVLSEVVYSKDVAMMMWVEKSSEGNVVCVLSQPGLYDLNITGYLIKGEDYKEVFSLDYVPKIKVETKRYGELYGVKIQDMEPPSGLLL